MIRSVLAALGAAALVLGPVAVPAAAEDPVALQALTWTADNDVTKYRTAPAAAVAGATTIVFENSEATGNTSGMTHTLTFDTSAPGYNHDVDLNIVASPLDANGGRHEAQVSLTPGKYRYFCAIPGHGQMVGEFTVTDGGGGDTTPPTVTAEITGNQNADGDYVGSATVTVAAEDAQSGVASVEYELDDTGFRPYTEPVEVTAIGDHAVQYRATDEAGNVSETASVPFTVVEPGSDDTTPPTVTAVVSGTRDADGAYVGSAMVTLSAEDAQSGVDTIEYQVHDGAWTAYTGPVVVTEVGAHMAHHRATDNAGNTSEVGVVSFTVVEAADDTTPPTVTATVEGERDSGGAYVGTATVTVAAEDAGSGVDLVEYALDGGAWTAYAAPVPVSAVGEHTARYRASDLAGNTSAEAAVSFTVVEPSNEDTTPPEVSVAVTGNLNSGWQFVDSATVTITARDAHSGVESVEYALADEWLPYAEPVVVGAAGRHTVRYRATDAAGNTSAEATASFTVVERVDDRCPDSDTRATVVIGHIDTGVENADSGNGCTINDLIDADGEFASHNAFVNHVKRVTRGLVADNVITSTERDVIIRAAARSEVGG